MLGLDLEFNFLRLAAWPEKTNDLVALLPSIPILAALGPDGALV